MRKLAVRELVGGIPAVVGLPKPFTCGECVKAIRDAEPMCVGCLL